MYFMADKKTARLFTVPYFPVRSLRSSALRYGVSSCVSEKTTQGTGDSLGGSEKNRGTVITSLQLAFRRCDRNFTPITFINYETPLAMKNMPDAFSIGFVCLQISPFETVILYSFWDIPPRHHQCKTHCILTMSWKNKGL